MAAHASRSRATLSTPVADAGHAVERATTTAEHLRERVDALFVGSALDAAGMRVGVEVELIPVRGRPPRPVPPDDTRAAIVAHDPALLADARISFEPGGQVELSPPPRESPSLAMEAVGALLARLDAALARRGIVAVSSGLNPWHAADAVGMHLDAERYRMMQRHFDSIGSAGRDMMRLSASLQICVDMCSGDDGVEQWLLANRMGPALSALFANSGVGAGEATGWSGTRSLVWQRLDASRTGFDGAQVAAGASTAYHAFAAGAFAMPLPRGADAVWPQGSFAAWLDGGTDRPDGDDVVHHLSTLFPPVRPRGYLEVRYVDAPPRRWMALPVVVVDTLLRDSRARRAALSALEDVDRGSLLAMWEASAHQGVVNPWLRHEALTLIEISLAACRRMAERGAVAAGIVDEIVAFRDDYLHRRRCWSDDQVDRISGPDSEDPTAWT
jgi:glutamate--cysteine ligase